MRMSTITNQASRPQTEGDIVRSIQLFGDALLGEHGNGDWADGGGVGMWTKSGESWQGKILFDSCPAIVNFPFRVVDSVVKINDLTNVNNVQTTQYYIENSLVFGLSSFVGKKIMLEVDFVKIVRG